TVTSFYTTLRDSPDQPVGQAAPRPPAAAENLADDRAALAADAPAAPPPPPGAVYAERETPASPRPPRTLIAAGAALLAVVTVLACALPLAARAYATSVVSAFPDMVLSDKGSGGGCNS
ncbi:MAG: hypothetical protein LBH76_01040, partial [Propionibacteriaceae bacterium]|nr:hypothetical protein [Propionibacteriaceae bacterium]